MFKKFFLYTRSEQRGVIVLFVVIILLLLYRFLSPHYLMKKYVQNESTYVAYFQHLNDSILQASVEKDTIFFFDPNKVKGSELEMLGFTAYQNRNFLAYRSAGGTFKSVSDIAKIYGVDSILLKRIGPYVRIRNDKFVRSNIKYEAEAEKQIKLNLNEVTFRDLKEVKGVSDKIAKRILKFRMGLGGFYDVKQLDEVYGLSKRVCVVLKDRFYVSDSDIKKVILRESDIYGLMRHSYLNKEQSKFVIDLYNECKVSGGEDVFCKQLKGNGLGNVIPYLVFD